MDHLEPLRRRIRSSQISAPPQPWNLLTVHAVGGLTEVGFADDSDLLLIVSSQGRSVVDCKTGERLARDRTEPDNLWYNERQLTAKGVGPLEGKTIRLAGLHGGGLPRGGEQGWSVEELAIDWPDISLMLVGPWQSIYNESTQFTKLAVERELRAFGFSGTGRSLIVATSSEVTLYRLDASAT
jgi:hypothetical protein